MTSFRQKYLLRSQRYSLFLHGVQRNALNRRFAVCRGHIACYVFDMRTIPDCRRRVASVTKFTQRGICRHQDNVTIRERTHCTCAVQAPISNVVCTAEEGRNRTRYVNRHVRKLTVSKAVIRKCTVKSVGILQTIKVERYVFKRCTNRNNCKYISFI